MLQDVLQKLKTAFYEKAGAAEGLNADQSEVIFDTTLQGVTDQLKGLIFSGKIGELQKLVSEGADAVRESAYFKSMVENAAKQYYGLDWDAQRKQQLAETTMAYTFNGLRDAFEASGKSKDFKGIMEFAGLDSGLLGKLGGLMGGFGKIFGK
jgi:hypothetical protein